MKARHFGPPEPPDRVVSCKFQCRNVWSALAALSRRPNSYKFLVLIIRSAISHYKIVEKLGDGSTDAVCDANATEPERAVMIKFLAALLLNDSSLL